MDREGDGVNQETWDAAVARIAELEAENENLSAAFDHSRDEGAAQQKMRQQAEADLHDYAKTTGNLRKQITDLKKIVGKQEHEIDDLRSFWTTTMMAMRFSFEAEPRDPQVSLNELRDEINAEDNVLDEKMEERHDQ